MLQLSAESLAFFDVENVDSTSISSPTYSRLPSVTEITLDAESLSCSRSSWKYQTKRMSIDLGKRLWKTRFPAYGLNDKVEGTIHVRAGHVESINVSLEGNLVTAIDADGGISKSHSLFMNHTRSIPLSNERDVYAFTMPIPSEITLQGVTALTPPSFYRSHLGVIGEIFYSLRISMTRRASRVPFKFEPNEVKIPILYFPKTRPADPPLPAIPKPPSDRELQFASPNVYISEHVDTYPLKPQWSSRVKRSPTNLQPFLDSVFFSLPAPQSFASGERIPFHLSLVFPNNPVLAAMYAKNIRVSLRKQLSVRPIKSSWRKLLDRSKYLKSPRGSVSPDGSDDERTNEQYGFHSRSSRSPSPSSHANLPEEVELDIDAYGQPVTTGWKLTSGRLETVSEYSEGVCLLRGWISAGELGRGCSWKIGELAQLQYFLEIEIDSPPNMHDHLPTFVLEKEVEIATDCWEMMNRELQSMGGLPTPALGLAKCLVDSEVYETGTSGNKYPDITI